MQIDTRLNEIDDCLYRVAIRALIVQSNKILLVQETPELWWAFPGGGIDHGETVASTLTREIEEELGVPASKVTSDLQIAYYTVGKVVNGVPRMNIFFKASIPEELLSQTAHIAKWAWFNKSEFMELAMNPSYDKSGLVDVIFGEQSA